MILESAKPNRLISLNYKPKQSPNKEPDSPTAIPNKKTRDFPNLSDCHGCGTHINNTNPQDRLLLLDSVWRIVLLCRKCNTRVHKLQICPYCFKECGSLEYVSCRDCQRGIHKECVVSFGDSSPWLLCKRELGLGLDGVFVCVDCWVPEVLKKSIRVVKRKKLGKDSSKNPKNGSRMRVDVLNDRGCSMGREVVLALMAPNSSSRKNVVARNVLEVDNGGEGSDGNGVICYKRRRGGKGGDSGGRLVTDVGGENKSGGDIGHGVVKDVDGENKLDGSDERGNELECSPITYRRKSKKLELRTYERGSSKRNVFLDKIKDMVSAEVGISESSLYEGGCLKRKIFVETVKDVSAEVVGLSTPCVYERASLKKKVFVETIRDASAEVVGISGTCERSTRNNEITSSEACDLNKPERVYERKCTNRIKCASDSSKKEVADNEKSDHCLLKYCKRQPIHKSQLSDQCNMVDRNQGSALESSVNFAT